MNFDEWFNPDEHDFYNFEEEEARNVWNAAIDEAAKSISSDNNSVTDEIYIARIKELKQ